MCILRFEEKKFRLNLESFFDFHRMRFHFVLGVRENRLRGDLRSWIIYQLKLKHSKLLINRFINVIQSTTWKSEYPEMSTFWLSNSKLVNRMNEIFKIDLFGLISQTCNQLNSNFISHASTEYHWWQSTVAFQNYYPLLE